MGWCDLLYRNIKSAIENLLKNPVYLKDRMQLSRRKHYSGCLLLLVIPAVFLIFLMDMDPEQIDNKNGECLFFSRITVFLLIFYFTRSMFMSGHLFVSEKNNRCFDTINTTLLTPESIITGKFLAVFLPLAYELTFMLPVLILFSVVSAASVLQLTVCYTLLILNIVLGCLTGLILSLTTENHAKNKTPLFFSIVLMMFIQLNGFILTAAFSLLCRLTNIHRFYALSEESANTTTKSIWNYAAIIFNPFFTTIRTIFFRTERETGILSSNSVYLTVFVFYTLIMYGVLIFYLFRKATYLYMELPENDTLRQ